MRNEWTAEDDELLKKCDPNSTSWVKIADLMNQSHPENLRSAEAVRNRYVRKYGSSQVKKIRKPDKTSFQRGKYDKRELWTYDEDIELVALVAVFGHVWHEMSSVISRKPHSMRNRFQRIMSMNSVSMYTPDGTKL